MNATSIVFGQVIVIFTILLILSIHKLGTFFAIEPWRSVVSACASIGSAGS